MSVVNKMLKDLETRQQSPSEHADYVPPKDNRGLYVRVVLMLIVILGVGAVVYWQFFGVANTQLHHNNAVPLGAAQPQNVSSLTPRANTSFNNTANASGDVNKGLANVSLENAADESMQPTVFEAEPIDDESEESAADNIDAQLVDVDSESQVANFQETISQPTVAKPITSQPESTEASPSMPEIPSSMEVSSSGNAERDEDELKQVARLALKENDTETAIQVLGQLLRSEPDNVNVRKQLAALLFANQQVPEAEVMLQEGLNYWPQNIEMRMMLARLYFQVKAFDKALEVLTNQQVDAAMHGDYVSFRASLAEQKGQHLVALTDYQRLLDAFPEEAKWWLGFAVVSERLKQFSQAKQAYRQAAKLQQLSPDVERFIQMRLRFLAGNE